MNKLKEITLIAPLPAVQKRTRVAKMVSYFRDHGIPVRFIGWERERGEADSLLSSDEAVRESIILTGGGYASSRARRMYPLWMLSVFWTVLRAGRNARLVCLGWETAFPALLASWFTGARIIFDDADRFSMIVKLPGPLHRIVIFLERWTSKNVFMHLVPGWSRYDWKSDNMLLLRNSPTSADVTGAKAMASSKKKSCLTLYANGWLGQTRGAPIFLEVLNRLGRSNANIAVHIAGRVDSPDGESLISHPMVSFHGEIDQMAALALYSASDIVLTYYDPAITINRQAESNKWGDCVVFETPFIVNSEVETAKDYVDKGAAFTFAYHDIDQLADFLQRLSEQKSILQPARTALAGFQEDFPLFDRQLEKVMEKLRVVDGDYV